MKPRVSICVPNLNTRPFLPERFQTILDQSFLDWELLVYDSYSNDGAWEFIKDLATREPRMRVWQGPREGTPGSWSPCIREARGEYVYIATSDDTMPPDCIEKLVAALDAHPDCDVAHCRLRAIDDNGNDISVTNEWWSGESIFALSSGPLLSQSHVRRAPFDGLLHLLGGSVYMSITQLLIRRTLFDRIGMFTSRWGSVGDFNWSMRAGLVANTVHVPDTWGGWRIHANQATAGIRFASAEHGVRIDAMIDDAIEASQEFLSPSLRERRITRWSLQAKELRAFHREVADRQTRSVWYRGGFILRRLCAGSASARLYLQSRLLGRSFPDWVRGRLDEIGYGPVLVPLPQKSQTNTSTIEPFPILE